MIRFGWLAMIMLAGCATAPSAAPRVIPVSYTTPSVLLSQLKAAAERPMNEYYAMLRAATDCKALPDVCRLFAARERAASEMTRFLKSMKRRFGSTGAAAAQQMIVGAFGKEYDALQYASVNEGTGDTAFLRIGEDIYRLRKSIVGWRIVQAPALKFDPAVTAEAIELLAARVEQVRSGIDAGQYGSVESVLLAIESAFS